MRLLIRRNTNGRARTVMLFNNRCFHTPYAQVTGGGRAGGGGILELGGGLVVRWDDRGQWILVSREMEMEPA